MWLWQELNWGLEMFYISLWTLFQPRHWAQSPKRLCRVSIAFLLQCFCEMYIDITKNITKLFWNDNGQYQGQSGQGNHIVLLNFFTTSPYMFILCCLKLFLDLKVLYSQTKTCLSVVVPQSISGPESVILQKVSKSVFLTNLFWLFSIIEFTLSSKSTMIENHQKSSLELPVFFFLRGGCVHWTCPLKMFFGIIVSGKKFWGKDLLSYSFKSLIFSSFFPAKPFSCSSSAISRNESRFSWKIFTAPR